MVLLQEEVLLEVLGLANQYGFVELQSAMSEYLKAVLHIRNVCLIFDIASMYGLRSLCETCCQFMDHNAAEILQSEGFLTLSLVCLSSFYSHCSICCMSSAVSTLCRASASFAGQMSRMRLNQGFVFLCLSQLRQVLVLHQLERR